MIIAHLSQLTSTSKYEPFGSIDLGWIEKKTKLKAHKILFRYISIEYQNQMRFTKWIESINLNKKKIKKTDWIRKQNKKLHTIRYDKNRDFLIKYFVNNLFFIINFLLNFNRIVSLLHVNMMSTKWLTKTKLKWILGQFVLLLQSHGLKEKKTRNQSFFQTWNEKWRNNQNMGQNLINRTNVVHIAVIIVF